MKTLEVPDLISELTVVKITLLTGDKKALEQVLNTYKFPYHWFPEDGKTPREQTEWAFELATNPKNAETLLFTYSDHILNALRISIKEKGLNKKDFLAYFFPYEAPQDVVVLETDDRGCFHSWPNGFFDEWDNSLTRLLW
jgi:hypothetical protein